MKKNVMELVMELARIESENELFGMTWAEFLESNGFEAEVDVDFSFKSDTGKRAERRKATAHKKQSRKALRAAKGFASDVRTDGKAKNGAIYHSNYDFRKWDKDSKRQTTRQQEKKNFERFYSADPDGNRAELEQRLISNGILIDNVHTEMQKIQDNAVVPVAYGIDAQVAAFRRQCEELAKLKERLNELLRMRREIIEQLCETSWGNC